jgi:hypothetical protein
MIAGHSNEGVCYLSIGFSELLCEMLQGPLQKGWGVLKFAESNVATKAQQASDGAGLMAMVHSQRRNLLRLSVYYPFRLLTDSAQTVLLLKHELVLDETDAILLTQVRITHTVRVRLAVAAFYVTITFPVSEPPLMFLLVVTD